MLLQTVGLELMFLLRCLLAGESIRSRIAKLEIENAQNKLSTVTGLLRMDYAIEIGSKMVSHARKLGSKIEVIIADIDGFGELNKIFGNKIGNVVLACLGDAFRSQLRGFDTAFVQGDEFLILSYESGHVHVLMKRVIDEWNRLVREHAEIMGLTPELTGLFPNTLHLSYGHQVLHPDEAYPIEVRFPWAMHEADTRMQSNKHDGKRYRNEGPQVLPMKYGRPVPPDGYIPLGQRPNPFTAAAFQEVLEKHAHIRPEHPNVR